MKPKWVLHCEPTVLPNEHRYYEWTGQGRPGLDLRTIANLVVKQVNQVGPLDRCGPIYAAGNMRQVRADNQTVGPRV